MIRTPALLLLLALVACAETDAAHLWNPKTDQIVNCPPVEDAVATPAQAPAPDVRCIEHYKSRGFVVVPGPR